MMNLWIDRDDLDVRMDGHADQERNPEGHDLVCACASYAVQAFAYTGQRYGHVEADFSHGRAHVRLRPIKRCAEDACRLLVYLEDGMHLIAEKYPEALKINVIE